MPPRMDISVATQESSIDGVLEILCTAQDENGEMIARLAGDLVPAKALKHAWLHAEGSLAAAIAAICRNDDPMLKPVVAKKTGGNAKSAILHLATLCVAAHWRHAGLGTRLIGTATGFAATHSPCVAVCLPWPLAYGRRQAEPFDHLLTQEELATRARCRMAPYATVAKDAKPLREALGAWYERQGFLKSRACWEYRFKSCE